MRRGAKPKADVDKAGLLKFAANPSEVYRAGDPPIMPEWLLSEAQLVWDEELGRVMRSGISELDSTLFATYCANQAAIRKCFAAGEVPPAAYLTEDRRRAELLGIAGPRVRTGSRPTDAKSDNPFSRNGHRPRA